MQILHPEQSWELARQRQAEMLKEAQMAHLADLAQKPQRNWLSALFQRRSQAPVLALEASATSELG